MTIEVAQVLTDLQRPTYQNRLRLIGRKLDLAGYHSLNLVEITGGFLVRALRPGERAPVALEFPHTDLQHLLASGSGARGEGLRLRVTHPLLPTGYEDFLRALGRHLDEQSVTAIAITELDSFIAVIGVAPLETYHATTMPPFQLLLYPDDIASLLNDAFRRRTPAVARTSTLASLFGH